MKPMKVLRFSSFIFWVLFIILLNSTLDLLPFKKHLSEMLFFRYFPLKNTSIETLFKDFLEKTNEKIAISYRHFLKGNKSIKILDF